MSNKKKTAYKGFDGEFRCRGYQYKIGGKYEEDKAELCLKGFHACEYPLEVFKYYHPATSRYAEVKLGDVSDSRDNGSTKVVGKKITIKAEIAIKGIVEASLKYIFEKIDKSKEHTNTGDQSAATNTGEQSAATNTGYRSVATNTGEQSAATNTGEQSAATNTGYRSAATNTGNRSAAIVTGKESVAIATGIGGRAKGSIGSWLVLAEYKYTYKYELQHVKSVIVDGEIIKENTCYTLRDGCFVEADHV